MNVNACTRPWWWLRADHVDNPIRTYRHDPLWLMLGLSLAIHLLVLVWLTLQPQQIQFRLPVSELAIHLQDNQTKTALETSRPPALKPVTTAASRPVPVRIKTTLAKTDALRHTIIKPKVAAKIAKTKPAETVRAKVATTLASRPSPAAHHTLSKKPSAVRISLSRVISRLQQDLKQYFYYPRLARRKNIQGGVVLGFAINRQGKINNIHIVKSSGFAILDFAAEDALRQLHKLNWSTNYLQRNNRHIELPVIYKLTES